MLVWIPRYAYKITSQYHNSVDANTAGKIKIKFINIANKESNGVTYSTTYPEVINEGTATGAMTDYVVHPAFSFGGTANLSGIWVGKYESSFVGTGTTAESGQYNGTEKTMQIKAGISSWRACYISNMFDVCLNMNKESNPYGLNPSDSVVDPHLMKNDEWGAVAYLSKSKYGKNNAEAAINSSSSFITGTGGVAASTTGNEYGVYDMNGGSWEYVAAYVNNGSENLTIYGSSLVNGAAKYKNVYTAGDSDNQTAHYALSTPANGHYGDAVWETSPNGTNTSPYSWYSDYSEFPCLSGPFFVRGGYYGNGSHAGMFAFGDTHGNYDNIRGFRVVVPVLQ